MQKHVDLVDLVKSFPTNIYLQNLASIQKRTSPVKFAHLAEKSGKDSMSNLSTKAPAAYAQDEAYAVQYVPYESFEYASQAQTMSPAEPTMSTGQMALLGAGVGLAAGYAYTQQKRRAGAADSADLEAGAPARAAGRAPAPQMMLAAPAVAPRAAVAAPRVADPQMGAPKKGVIVFWSISRARSWLYKSRFLQVNTQSTFAGLFELYKICTLLNCSNVCIVLTSYITKRSSVSRQRATEDLVVGNILSKMLVLHLNCFWRFSR